MITSLTNEKVKHARGLGIKKNRQAHQQFLVEGVRIIEEAERAGVLPALVFFEPAAVEAVPRARNLLARLASHISQVEAVSTTVLDALAETETPQGLIAVYSFLELPLPHIPRFMLVLDGVRDPGNTGTILRTAWAAGVDGILLAPDTADPYNPKVVRSAMGAHFSLPIKGAPWSAIRSILKPIPRVYLADPHSESRFDQVDWSAPRAIIVGGEASGASAEAAHAATSRITIPMPGHAESLNAAVAAGIILFEAVRRERAA